jgi:hypothetical protein
MLGLEFLEANNVRLSLGEPCQEVLQAFVDVVDLEGGDFHRSDLKAQGPAAKYGTIPLAVP